MCVFLVIIFGLWTVRTCRPAPDPVSFAAGAFGVDAAIGSEQDLYGAALPGRPEHGVGLDIPLSDLVPGEPKPVTQ